MDNTLKVAEATVVAGVADNRSVPLDRLAGDHGVTTPENLRLVLPEDAGNPMPTASFGSSI